MSRIVERMNTQGVFPEMVSGGGQPRAAVCYSRLDAPVPVLRFLDARGEPLLRGLRQPVGLSANTITSGPRSGLPSSSSSPDEGRFAAGSVVAGRYRIGTRRHGRGVSRIRQQTGSASCYSLGKLLYYSLDRRRPNFRSEPNNTAKRGERLKNKVSVCTVRKSTHRNPKTKQDAEG